MATNSEQRGYRAEHEPTRVLVVAERNRDAKAELLVRLLTVAGLPSITTAVASELSTTQLKSGFDGLFVLNLSGNGLTRQVAGSVASVHPWPWLVSVGAADRGVEESPVEDGVAWHLPWPPSALEVLLCVRTLTSTDASFESAIRGVVGRMTLKEVQHYVRDVMVERALSASRGSRRGAAQILGVTRPAVQRALKAMEESTSAREVRRIT